jgi:D-alanyl-D-alanine carboxypeptidase
MIVAVACEPAEARWHKRKTPRTTTSTSIVSDPRYADIVIDANTGDVLHAAHADNLRHPASVTKIMTLYLLFERIEAGKITLDTPLEVSAAAASQAPSKLGLRPGQTIKVEDAIKALVTKSANDVAVVIAEALGGTEDEFARQMTRKARALGMSRTIYRNASGLPNDEQVTTARDQALLALAIQERFPKFYSYFSTRQFVYRGHAMRNHNHLLGTVEGVDGIKTGYTNASGFNLVTSVRRGQRHVIAAVFGGRTAAQRDARMRDLIETHFAEASTKHTAPRVAEKNEPARTANPKMRLAATEAAEPKAEGAPARQEPVTTAAIPAPRPAPGSTDPIKPHVVRTLSVKPGTVQVAAVAPLSLLSPQPVTSQDPASRNTPPQATSEAALPPPPPGARPGILGVLPAKAAAEPAPAPTPALASAAPAAPREVHAKGGWVIQVGAFDDEGEAKQRLSHVQDKFGSLLGKADPFTEPVTKGDKKLYRARFAGLDQNKAEAACRQLKRNDIACMAMRN